MHSDLIVTLLQTVAALSDGCANDGAIETGAVTLATMRAYHTVRTIGVIIETCSFSRKRRERKTVVSHNI